MLTIVIQVVMAVILLIVMLVVAFYIYNKEYVDAIRSSSSLRKKTEVFVGIKDIKSSNNETYNVVDRESLTFRDIGASINQHAGAEFTYNFWLFKDNAIGSEPLLGKDIVNTDTGLQAEDIILFTKGSNKVFNYKNQCGALKDDILVKCPLVKLERGGDVLTVELNTIQSPDGTREMSRNTCEDKRIDWNAMNSHKVSLRGLRNYNFDKKWFMVTVIVRDTAPTEPLPMRNKVNVKMYVNGVKELDRMMDGKLAQVGGSETALRQNEGHLYVAPIIRLGAANIPVYSNFSEQSLMMADLSYFNYNLSPEEVKQLFDAKYTKKVAASITDSPNGRDAINNTGDLLSFADGKKQLTAF